MTTDEQKLENESKKSESMFNKKLKDHQKKAARKVIMNIMKTKLMLFGLYALISLSILIGIFACFDFLIDGGDGTTSNKDFSTVGYDGTLYGSTTEEKIWNFLIANGATKKGAAAMMGNIERESTFNIEATNGTHTGLCQWSNDNRFENLKTYAENNEKEWNDLQVQLEFMWQEIETSYKKSYTAITTTDDIDEATIIIRDNFEVPFAKSEMGTEDEINDAKLRKEYAHKWYEKFKDLTTSVYGMTGGIDLYNSDGTVNEEAINKLNNYLTSEVLNTTIHQNYETQNGPFGKWWTSSYTSLTKFQCTWWAYGRASQYLELTGSKYTSYPTQHGNGGKYYGINAYGASGCNCGICSGLGGLKGGWFNYGQSPRANSLISWSGGDYGHVAYVEAVDSTGIWISHAGSGKRWYGVQKINLDGSIPGWSYKCNGYIYLDSPK